ncbi:MAG: hypothetical protein IJX14_11440 [Clostridia bacterium]|nr:hypothetical protein [Clostridia bacterium]
MEKIISDMIEQAEANEDLELLEYTRRLVEELADTINCPSNWRNIGEQLAQKYKDNDWVYGYMQLYYYEG